METFDTGARIAVLENEIKNIAEDVKEIRKENKEQHAVLMSKFESFESRIAIIERWRWMVVGGAAPLGYLINHFYKFF